jgi:hypothetical protein
LINELCLIKPERSIAMNPVKMFLIALAIGCTLFVAACGGGSSYSSASPATPSTPSAAVTNGTAATAAVTVTTVM